jgi:hypothetical protein
LKNLCIYLAHSNFLLQMQGNQNSVKESTAVRRETVKGVRSAFFWDITQSRVVIHSTLRNIPEECRSHQHGGGSLKSQLRGQRVGGFWPRLTLPSNMHFYLHEICFHIESYLPGINHCSNGVWAFMSTRMQEATCLLCGQANLTFL